MSLGQNFVQVQLLLVRLFDEIHLFFLKEELSNLKMPPLRAPLGNPLKEAKE